MPLTAGGWIETHYQSNAILPQWKWNALKKHQIYILA